MSQITFQKAAKLSDVAEAAGVSKGTASNVFNRPEVVREEVRKRVLAAAKSIGYHGPDPKGRLLSAGKVNAIGVATVEPLSYFFDDPFARVLMTGITEACDASGTGISLVSAASEEELAWNVSSALVDGFILFCLEGAERLIALSRERQLPFVAMAFGPDETMSVVGIDDVAAARLAAQHLTELGHRRFAVLAMDFAAWRVRPGDDGAGECGHIFVVGRSRAGLFPGAGGLRHRPDFGPHFRDRERHGDGSSGAGGDLRRTVTADGHHGAVGPDRLHRH